VIAGISEVVKDWVNARTMTSGDRLDEKKMFHELMVAMDGIEVKFVSHTNKFKIPFLHIFTL